MLEKYYYFILILFKINIYRQVNDALLNLEKLQSIILIYYVR